MEREFDVVVIGAGPAGEVAAGRLTERGGKQVVIVERDLVGGECSYYACMPSKALLRPGEALAEVRRIPGAAQAVTGELDVEAVLSRRDDVAHGLRDDDQLPWLSSRGIELVRGHARLDGERRVRVGDDLLSARDAVVIAVGTGALMPPIPGLAEAHAWSNREATTAREVPHELLVLGGGAVGAEMAQAWSSLGSRVTLVEAMERLLPHEEPFAGEQVRACLERHGVAVHTGVMATRVDHDEHTVTLHLANGESVSGTRLLVAIGRRPATAGLGLEQLGVSVEGYIKVDEHMRVPGAHWLYAIGDVNGRSLLTHAGKYQARIAADHILGEDAIARTDGPIVPRVTFTDPAVAAVGLTLMGALEAGIMAEPIDLPTDGTAGASFVGRGAGGTTRFVVDVDEEVLVGATFVGPGVADFLQAATIAITARVPLTTLAHAIAAFPTRSELWLKFIEAFEAARGTTLLAGPHIRSIASEEQA